MTWYICDDIKSFIRFFLLTKALLALIYWAALTNNPKIVKSLWLQSEQPMVTALIISRIWHQLSKKWVKDLDTKRQLKEDAM